MSMRRFIVSDETDDNVSVYVRELNGSMTEARRNIVDTFVKRYNQDNSAPYGVSPNGYPYTCGHEWDCCGCMIDNYMTVVYENDKTVLRIIQSFNF